MCVFYLNVMTESVLFSISYATRLRLHELPLTFSTLSCRDVQYSRAEVLPEAIEGTG